jgi:hypothetical protein
VLLLRLTRCRFRAKNKKPAARFASAGSDFLLVLGLLSEVLRRHAHRMVVMVPMMVKRSHFLTNTRSGACDRQLLFGLEVTNVELSSVLRFMEPFSI